MIPLNGANRLTNGVKSPTDEAKSPTDGAKSPTDGVKISFRVNRYPIYPRTETLIPKNGVMILTVNYPDLVGPIQLGRFNWPIQLGRWPIQQMRLLP